MADRYGSACMAPKSAPFRGVCAVKAKKTGQVLVRTLGCEKASDFSHRNRVMSGDLNLMRPFLHVTTHGKRYLTFQRFPGDVRHTKLMNSSCV